MNLILSKSKIFLFCLISFIVGIGIASWLPLKFLSYDVSWFIVALFCLAITIIFWPTKNSVGAIHKLPLLCIREVFNGII